MPVTLDEHSRDLFESAAERGVGPLAQFMDEDRTKWEDQWAEQWRETAAVLATEEPAVVSYTAPDWLQYKNLQVYLMVTAHDAVRCSVTVDWGPFFDGAQHALEDLPAAERFFDVWVGENLRFRTYRGAAAHAAFSINALRRADYDSAPYSYFLDHRGRVSSEKVWEYNQFFFQTFHRLGPIAEFLAPVEASFAAGPGSREFALWLHLPRLLRMRSRRRRVRAAAEFAERSCLAHFELRGGLDALPEGRLTPLEPAEVSVRGLQHRIEASLWALHDATPEPLRRDVDAGAFYEDEVDEEEDEDATLSDNFPVRSRDALTYAQSDGFSKRECWRYMSLYTVVRDEGGDVALLPRAHDFVDEGWEPVDDPLGKLYASELVQPFQVATFQSVLGTRVHMWFAHEACGRALDEYLNSDRVEWKRLRHPEIFFPAVGAAEAPSEKKAYLRVPVSGPAGGGPEEARFVNETFSKYIEARADDDVKAYCGLLAREKFASLVMSIFEAAVGEAVGVEFVGVEIPVYHPFAIFQHGKTFKFFRSQMDCLMLATTAAGDKKLVVVELKTLAEFRPPEARLRDNKNASQPVINALLIEMQAGVRVDLAVTLYLSRKPKGAVGYVSVGLLRDAGGENFEWVRRLREKVWSGAFLRNHGDRERLFFDGRLVVAQQGSGELAELGLAGPAALAGGDGTEAERAAYATFGLAGGADPPGPAGVVSLGKVVRALLVGEHRFARSRRASAALLSYPAAEGGPLRAPELAAAHGRRVRKTFAGAVKEGRGPAAGPGPAPRGAIASLHNISSHRDDFDRARAVPYLNRRSRGRGASDALYGAHLRACWGDVGAVSDALRSVGPRSPPYRDPNHFLRKPFEVGLTRLYIATLRAVVRGATSASARKKWALLREFHAALADAPGVKKFELRRIKGDLWKTSPTLAAVVAGVTVGREEFYRACADERLLAGAFLRDAAATAEVLVRASVYRRVIAEEVVSGWVQKAGLEVTSARAQANERFFERFLKEEALFYGLLNANVAVGSWVATEVVAAAFLEVDQIFRAILSTRNA